MARSTIPWGFALAEPSPAEPLGGAALKLLCINKELSKSLAKARRWEVQNWLMPNSVLTQCFFQSHNDFPCIFAMCGGRRVGKEGPRHSAGERGIIKSVALVTGTKILRSLVQEAGGCW